MYLLKHKTEPCFIARPDLPSLLTTDRASAQPFESDLAATLYLAGIGQPAYDYNIVPFGGYVFA